MPAIELRRCIQLCTNRNGSINNDFIKLIVSAAFHKVPLTIIPSFADEIKSIANLIDKGILYYDKEKEQYFYTF